MSIQTKELSLLVTQIKRGLSTYYHSASGRKVSYINLRAVSEAGIIPDRVEHIAIKTTAALEKARVKPGDIILTSKGSTFRATLATESERDYVLSSNVIALSLSGEVLPELVAAYLNSPRGQSELRSRAVGIAQKTLNIRSLLAMAIPVLPRAKQRQLAEYLVLARQYETLLKREQQLRRNIIDYLVKREMNG